MTTTAPAEPTLKELDFRIKELEARVFTRSFILYYHYRQQRPLEKIFEFNGDLAAAKDEGRRHCEVMGYRYLTVRPLIVDLKWQEKLKRETTNYVEESY